VDGILLVDKPAGWTSHDVVAKIRNILATEVRSENSESRIIPNSKFPIPNSRRLKVGHTGTLDPAATGLLILVLGKYTKRAAEFSKLDKTYETEVILGKTSSTGDSEGKIVQKSDTKPSLEQVQEVLHTFLGEIEQTPPAFSAIKVDGQRAYKLARAGKEVKLEPRKVTIHEISGIGYEYPKLSFTTSVSSGTYIRSLAEDIGTKLGTAAYMSSLRRTQVGKSSVNGALSPNGLTFEQILSGLQPSAS
jgi:tRNA pseudouridine55 synthase